MNDRPQNPDSLDDASEITIATPRFDAAEARRASPVVPLAHVRSDELTAHSAFRRRARRSWPLGVVIVTLLAVAAIAGIGSKVLRRDGGSQNQTPAAHRAEATLHAPNFSSASQPREESRAGGGSFARRAARPAPAEEIFVAGDDEDSDDDDDEKDRERGRGKRKGHKDGDRGDLEKILKDAKKNKKAVRVGVIVGN